MQQASGRLVNSSNVELLTDYSLRKLQSPGIKVRLTSIVPHLHILSVTERAGVQRRWQAKPARTDFDPCCHTAVSSPSLPF